MRTDTASGRMVAWSWSKKTASSSIGFSSVLVSSTPRLARTHPIAVLASATSIPSSGQRRLCLLGALWGMAGGKERRDHVRDRIGRGLEGHGKGLLSTRLQGAELLLLKSGKVLARKAPGAFLSTEYFCRSWGHQCARLLKCSAPSPAASFLPVF